MLWTWVILNVITYSSTLSLGIVEAASDTMSAYEASAQLVAAAIAVFCIYCVHRRIKDVRMNQQIAVKGYKAGRLDSSPRV